MSAAPSSRAARGCGWPFVLSGETKVTVQNPRMWKGLRSLQKHPVRIITTPPHPNEFADMLETLFPGNALSPERSVITLGAPWQRSDLTKLVQRMKAQKAADECGLVAKLLKHVPGDVLTDWWH